MSTTTFLKNAAARHQIFVERFAGGRINDLLKELKGLEKELVERIKKASPDTANKRKLNALYTEIQGLIAATYSNVKDISLKAMEEFGNYESGFTARMLSRASDVEFSPVAANALKAAIGNSILELGNQEVSVDDVFDIFAKQKSKEIVAQVKNAVILGIPTEEIVSEVAVTTRTLHRRQLNTVVRTVVNKVSQLSRDLTIKENSDLIEKVIIVATLDSKTSATCRSLDGQEFNIDEGPRPPFHWRCRTTTIPKVKKEYTLPIKGERPSVGADGTDLVGGQTTYNSWLKKQPASFQDEVLGPARGKLFREGGLSMNNFVDSNYQEYTLEQLKRKEPLAFDKAGLN